MILVVTMITGGVFNFHIIIGITLLAKKYFNPFIKIIISKNRQILATVLVFR